MKTNVTLVLAVGLLVSSVISCGPVKYVKTWKNPEAQPIRWEGKKVAVFAMTRLKATREGAEQALARELTRRGALGVPGFSIIPPAAEKDKELAKRILTDAGIAGAVIMQVVDIKDDIFASGGDLYLVGSSYMDFWGYWGTGWNVAYTQGAVWTKTTLVVETLVYSVDQDKLLWAGTSKTTDPQEVDKVVRQLVDAAAQEVRKAGLLSR